MIRFHF